MKLPGSKLTQPTLTDEFRPSVAPPVQVQKIRRARLLATARVLPSGTRHNVEPYQQAEKMAEVQRLMAAGMTREDAYRQVGW